MRASASSVGVSDLPGRPPVAGDAQAVGPQGVDGDDQDVALEARRRAARRRAMVGASPPAAPARLGGRLGVATLAVLVDAVAGDVLGARVDVAARVVAVAAAEARREAVAVVIGGAARDAQQRGASPTSCRRPR